MKKQWTIITPYEYDEESHQSWYLNFDWQPDFIGDDDQSRYLGKHNEFVDKLSPINWQYKEKSLKPRSEGWYNWIGDQVGRAVKSDTGYVEFDNLDNIMKRDPIAVMEAYQLAITWGLKILLKNPTAGQIAAFNLKDRQGNSAIAGCVFEAGSMTPEEFAECRPPGLQATWVYHSGNRNRAEIHHTVDEVNAVKGTSVQWGPSEYHDMMILLDNPL
jgi:hypothetical protein